MDQPKTTGSRNSCKRKTFDTDRGFQMAAEKAEREGFEPSEPLRVHRFSRPARSATLSPLLQNRSLHTCNGVSSADRTDARTTSSVLKKAS